ncbi:MAG: hypothetical protein C4297_07015 [Gemmataceae bacterium]
MLQPVHKGILTHRARLSTDYFAILLSRAASVVRPATKIPYVCRPRRVLENFFCRGLAPHARADGPLFRLTAAAWLATLEKGSG